MSLALEAVKYCQPLADYRPGKNMVVNREFHTLSFPNAWFEMFQWLREGAVDSVCRKSGQWGIYVFDGNVEIIVTSLFQPEEEGWRDFKILVDMCCSYAAQHTVSRIA